MVGGGRPLLGEILGQPTPLERNRLACVRQRRINNDNNNQIVVFTFDSIDVKFVKSNKNAVNADRIMKFIDENELNYI